MSMALIIAAIWGMASRPDASVMAVSSDPDG
jgi:hypothetical protein